jgi:hypothetical protein
MGVTVARVSQIENDVSTQEVLSRYIVASAARQAHRRLRQRAAQGRLAIHIG